MVDLLIATVILPLFVSLTKVGCNLLEQQPSFRFFSNWSVSNSVFLVSAIRDHRTRTQARFMRFRVAQTHVMATTIEGRHHMIKERPIRIANVNAHALRGKVCTEPNWAGGCWTKYVFINIKNLKNYRLIKEPKINYSLRLIKESVQCSQGDEILQKKKQTVMNSASKASE